ncbi:hypothetical protein PCCS19_16050 [Paenibacillus sp. CCS19]|nr:hypothetical protein PCCS19_16050 [Paenibacillus cellulosilyticus]
MKSIERNPTKYTLWMLNRIINGEEDKSSYIAILERVVNNKDRNEEIILLASEFLSQHN